MSRDAGRRRARYLDLVPLLSAVKNGNDIDIRIGVGIHHDIGEARQENLTRAACLTEPSRLWK